MRTTIETKEQDLFKITTIKKKHAEQVRENYAYGRRDFDWSTVEVLGYIDVWSGILIRDENGHFKVKSGTDYSDWLQRHDNLDGTAAWAKIKQLKQLFLD